MSALEKFARRHGLRLYVGDTPGFIPVIPGQLGCIRELPGSPGRISFQVMPNWWTDSYFDPGDGRSVRAVLKKVLPYRGSGQPIAKSIAA
jgi:hypothetical protein